MNGSVAALWTAVGLVTGMVLAPSAFWLAGTVQLRRYRTVLAAITATAFLLAASRYSTGSELLAHSVFIAIAVLLATVDILVRQLPRALIWPTSVAITGILVTETIRSGDVTGLLRAISASAALAGGYLVIAIVSHGGLGAGDVRLAVLVGGVLGWHSWAALVGGAALGFISTGVVAALHAAGHRMPSALPHGPGMLIGTFVALLL